MIDTFRLRLARVTMIAGIVVAGGCGTLPPASKHDDATHREGAVSYSRIEASASEQYKLTQSEHAFGAQLITNDPPAYPEILVGKALPPTTIRVKAIVDEAGHVSDVRDLDSSPDPDRQALFQACRTAVMGWTFSPMTIVQESDDGRGNIRQVKKNAAFSLDYAFRFELVGGRPRVTATNAATGT
ncbi:hypothetical protein J2T07_000350 [Luteibacter jiangsuensis]|uniref:TonB family protein n=1 Tax=Luteibacter jiangsuensis TaxID=637577 RepID=A0ABT9ST68_9GAMM|nr:hypothetical protein [Luteibacter jiangsuensis]MDQ0008191.1 hypothetical protein [Luteibacter jiangsuensis]